MTDDVANLVLRNNYLQTQAISMSEMLSAERLDELARLITDLERTGELDRDLEFLPDESEIEDRLRTFLTRAFRTPIDEPTLERYKAHVLARIADGTNPGDAMKAAASAAIASPRFLYLYDGASQKAGEAINDLELASRLSFFLWGSIPDQELLDAAIDGKLSNEAALPLSSNECWTTKS